MTQTFHTSFRRTGGDSDFRLCPESAPGAKAEKVAGKGKVTDQLSVKDAQ
ncbi:MAG TPA: hypothetical protein VHY84_03795 [Bryobacteraceae bacterium]|jgi:hypothetical protein|nr:hypothetical protein [Bryobacteraceae bacterium]